MNSKSTSESRKAVVAGATGYLGQHVVRALHRDGWAVRALARDAKGLEKVKNCCDDIFVGQAMQKKSIDGLFEGVDSVFSSIGIRHFRRHPTYEEVDYLANNNLVEAAFTAGVRRFVFVSVLDGRRMRSLSPLVDARERVVDRLHELNMETIIIRPTGFFNDMGDFFQMARKGKVWLIGNGETRINPIHGADLADVVASVMAAENPEPEISLGGPDVFSQREIADLAFQALGTTPCYGRVSPGLIRLLARLIRPFNKNASALAMMFSTLGDRDGVTRRFGNHRLEAFFRQLAEG